MKKLFFSLVLIFFMSNFIFFISAESTYDFGGGGTESNPYIISKADDMIALSTEVSAGNDFSGIYFRAVGSVGTIQLNNFTPIGSSSNPFRGSFDGDGVTFDLTINRPGVNYQGLFGYLDGGKVSDLSVSGSVIGGSYSAGVVAYQRSGIVENVYNKASISGVSYVGGISGYTYTGNITESYNTGNINATGSHIGGIAGYIHGRNGTMVVTRTYNTGQVNGASYVGGIIGSTYTYSSYKYSTVSYSYSAGQVSASSGSGVGGVIGSYSSSANYRIQLYYDVSKIVNYEKPANTKPSILQTSTDGITGITTEDFLSNYIQSKFTSGWVFNVASGTTAYYPELEYFANHPTNSKLVNESKASVQTFTGDGLGSENNPFLIRTVNDLNDLKVKILAGNTFEGFFFKVDDGIESFDLGNFSPIGTSSKPFYGSFDGNDAVFNLAIDSSDHYQGLFGYFALGTIKNLSVTGSVKGGSYTGGIVGYQASGVIENVYNLADVQGVSYVGGISGYTYTGDIRQAYNAGDITASSSHAGGIAGYIHGRYGRLVITNTYNQGEILANANAGGLVGYVYNYSSYKYSTISYSYSAGLVSANSNAGGVIGSYASNANTRTHIYYDMSVIAMYDQPLSLKPAYITDVYGLDTSKMIIYGSPMSNFSSDFWSFKTRTDEMGFYPQLKVFSEHTVSRISSASLDSVSINVSYGMGTETFPFLIKTAEDMFELSRKVSEGNKYTGYYFKVDDGIDELILNDFTPIGVNNDYSFEGIFDGNGANFKITVNNPTLHYQGLFGYVTNKNAVIKNLSVSGEIKGNSYVGSVVGYLRNGTIRDVYNQASVIGSSSHIGGIVGYVYGKDGYATVTNTYNQGEITGASYVGGIIGTTYSYSSYNYSTISYSYSAGQVSATSGTGAGGVIGSYASRANRRTHLYYDITEIVNYAKAANTKPSTDPVTADNIFGVTSGQLISDYMAPRLSTGWILTEKADGFGYYPQLSVFTSDDLGSVKARSLESVKIYIGDGLGTEDLPFLIRTIEDIEAIKTKLEAGNTFEGFFFKVDDGIDGFDLGNFSPIGTSSKPFYGSFDGNDAVFNLAIDRTDNYQGLFGYFALGTIKNLSVTGSVKGGSYTGGIVGYQASGVIENVYNLANINGVSYVGGIAGYMYTGDIRQVYNDGNVTASSSHAGGIAGYIHGRYGRLVITNTYNQGEILANANAGGLVGYVYNYSSYKYSTISYSYSAGLVSANSNAGGVIGSYASNANTRTHIYYDMSVIAMYDQPLNLKPAYITDVYGLDTGGLIQYIAPVSNFDENIWDFKAKTDDYGYYPQLRVFSTHSEARIASESLSSVTVNISGGMGTETFPFLIKTAEDMFELSRKVSEGNKYTGYYFKVDDGIDELILNDFTPIGVNNDYSFEGIFDGNGANFKITVNNPTLHYQGLFGYVTNKNAVIKNLSVSGEIKGNSYVGSVVGYLRNGTVRDVYNQASVIGSSSHIGGIVGYIYGRDGYALVSNTYNVGEITGSSYVGGIIGTTYSYSSYNYSTVSYSYSAGQVSASSGSSVGGVIGSYSSGANRRINLYYDITEIVNYAKPANTKPSTDPVTADNIFGLTSGQLISDYMATRLTSGWVLTEKADGFGYYPQLSVFTSDDLAAVKARSLDSVKIFIGDGLGTEDLPFLIRTIDDIEAIKTKLEAGNTFEGFFFKVDDGIDSFDLGNFSPIGTSSKPFYGSFDGNGAVFNLAINRTDNYTALFGYFALGTIKNLSVTGSVKGGSYTGGIVGYQASGVIENVYNLADVNGVSYVGGISGYTYTGDIRQAYNAGDITASSSHAGGIAGYIHGRYGRLVITNTYNRGEIIANSNAGGLVGYVYNYSSYKYSTISYSYSAGLVSANSNAGGVIGYYASNANTRTHIYYDVSVLVSYEQPRTYKPSTTIGGYGISKTDMLEDGMADRGFSSIVWEFRPIEGNYAYYPQLKAFSESSVERISNQSILSVRTNPFLGDGTLASPFLIRTPQDMINLAKSISADYDALGVYYLVEEGVNYFELTDTEFLSIGSLNTPFRGYFDGNYATFNLDIDGGDYQGLFGYISQEATLKRFGVSGSVNGSNYVGSIAGYSKGHVSEVYSTATVSANDYVGGLLGYSTGSLEYAYHTSDVSANANVGGLVGYNTGSIQEAYVGARVTGKSQVGAIVGFESGTTNLAYYDETIISYHEHPESEKPTGAFGNIADKAQVRGYDKEYLKGLNILGLDENQLQLSTDVWLEQDTSGLYDFYPQLQSFRNHLDTDIQAASQMSARTIRFAHGTGSKTNPYIIRDAEDMKAISDITKQEDLYNVYFKVADGIDAIDLTSDALGYEPIGSSSSRPFRGGFDGNGTHFIINLTTRSHFRGLFGYLKEGADIRNLEVSGFVHGYNYVGGVVGYGENAIIENVRNYADITGYDYVGGIAGVLKNTSITYAMNQGEVIGDRYYVGGIIGHSTDVDLNQAYNFGDISGNAHIGGVIGRSEPNTVITNVYNRASVIGTGNYVGGITGYLNGSTLDQSYSAGIVRGNDQAFVGGLVGRVNGITFEANSYYDESIIEADDKSTLAKPDRAIGNKLNYDLVKGVSKTLLTGQSKLSLDESIWTFTSNSGVDAFYPQLTHYATSSNQRIKDESRMSVRSYIFAGEGIEDSPYIIVDEQDMVLLSSLVNEGTSFTNTYFRVRKNANELNMTLTGLNYTPIGSNSNPFDGHFNGSGTNFVMGIDNTQNEMGLFGYVSINGSIRNLSVSGSIKAQNYVGAIAGYNQGFISEVYSTASIEGNDYIGGLVGYNTGTIQNIYMIGQVQANQYVGGLIGYNEGNLLNAYAVSETYGQSHIGGLVGFETEGGYTSFAYYNESIIEIYDKDGFNKPIQAISNKEESELIYGEVIENMTSGQLGSGTNQMYFDDLTYWTPEDPYGFNLFYPQLSVFSQSENEVIRQASLDSVKIDRFTEGDGSIDNPYVIRTASDMKGVSDLILAKDTLKGTYFIVADDVKVIDLTDPELNYISIGNASYKFEGHFDGNGTRFILNISVNAYYQGLFGYIGADGVVKNVSVQGSVYGSRFAGGIAGRNEGHIYNAYNLADITANDYYAGGITGYNSGVIEYTYNAGHIVVNRYRYAGGIAGRMTRNAVIQYSYNVGQVDVDDYYAGGIVGYNDGNVLETYNAGIITGGHAGAIVGANTSYASTNNSYYDKTVFIFSEFDRTATRGVGNQEDNELVFGVNTSQFTGDDLYDISLNFDHFILKQNIGYDAFYPQLKVFNQSDVTRIKDDSLLSVSTKLFNGQGTEESPFLLIDRFDVKALSVLTLQGVNTEGVYYQVYEAEASLDIGDSNLYFTPIGTQEYPFAGHFLGNGAEMILDIDSSNDYQGMFGVTSQAASIKNLYLSGSVKGNDFVGSLVGENNGLIENVIAYSSVSANNNAGGLVGFNKGTIYLSAHKATINGHDQVGGLAGANEGLIEQSYHQGNVASTGQMTGGIAGYNSSLGQILSTFNHGDIASDYIYTGGLVGYNAGLIDMAYHVGDIKSEASYASGIAAYNEGIIRDVFSAGEIYGKGNVSGLVVENTGTLENAYYDLTKIEESQSLAGYDKPLTAVHAMSDTARVKGLSHEEMTGLYSIGTYEHQMYFGMDEWTEKAGYDFVTYYPEMVSFTNLTNQEMLDDSLASITSRKIEGEGTQSHPYIIYDAQDMLVLKSFVENEHTFENKYFEVAEGVSTIDLSSLDEAYTPIGTTQFHFSGIFDGKGVNFVLDLNQPLSEYMGLFHTLGSQAVIKNMEISGSIIGQSYVGSIAGRNMGTIINVTNYASISSIDGNDIGGIAGFNEGSITEAMNKGPVTMNGTYAGGITGQNTGTITYSYNKAPITGNTSIGGIVGRNLATIKYTYNNANIQGDNVIGGIAGENISRIDHSFNHGDILANVSVAGGIAGSMNQAGTTAEMIIVYNTGHVRSATRLAGGLVGHFESGKIQDGYSGGTVEAMSDFGALVGQQLGGSISRSYYDLNAIENFENELLKPEKAIGNQADTETVKGLYRGQMAGQNSIGTHTTQMDFYYKSHFISTASYDQWSFYPQIKAFTDSDNPEVVEDSLESVRGLTFVIGSGTELDPYIIANESDMIALAETTNSGNDYSGIYFKVKDDIKILDFTNTDVYKYMAIGHADHPFNGHFNGNGTHIKLLINETQDYQGLFGYVDVSGYVGNISVSGVIQGNHYVGGIAGYNLGLIENVYNQADIQGKDYTGGLVGYHSGTIQNAYNRGEVIGRDYVGGIAGYADSYIEYTYNTGVIYGSSDVGALVGLLNQELITYSYYDTRVLSAYRDYGSLIKPISGVGNSYNSETVKGLDKNFLTGTSVFGTGDFSMNFTAVSDLWTTTYNIEDESYYPQLKIFSRSDSQEVKDLSKASAQTTLYKINYDYRGATEDNEILYTYAMKGYHYTTPVGFKFGFEFTGWQYQDDTFNVSPYTNSQGLSLYPYAHEENISLYAEWEVAEHVVKFIDGNGNVIEELIVVHGDTILESSLIPEKNPSRTKVYFFDTWNFDFSTRILENTNITANYIEKDRYYKVTYLDGDGEFFKEVRVEYGNTTEAITDIPTKTYVGDVAYKFTNWNFDFTTEITESISIQPEFTEVDRYYEVRFFDGNNQVIETQTVEYLAHAMIPNIKVTKDDSVSHTYTFIGWEDTYKSIQANVDVYPIFEEEIRTYTVTFMDGNSEIFATQTVNYGESAAEPSGLPRKNSHDDTAYKFTGWNLTYDAVESDMIILAQFEAVDRFYTVTFVDGDGSLMHTETVEYLNSASEPSDTPSKEQTVSHIYEFIEWDQDFSMVESNMTVSPVFNESLRPYTVTFLDGNGDVFDTQSVLYGNDALLPTDTPRKAGHDQIGYKFTSWSDYQNITEDRTVTSSFTPVDRYYIVTFYSHDGNTILSSQKIEYGFSATPPVAPERVHPNINYEYIFLGWDKDSDFVESNLNVYAQYESKLKTYTVTFINGDETTTQIVSYGQNATAPTPYKTGSDQVNYRFIEWDTVFTSVTEDLTVTAIFEAEYTYYLVEFYNGDGSLMTTQEVVPGQNAVLPSETPVKDKTLDSIFIFTNWDKSYESIDSDLKIYPIFNEVDRYYTVNFYDEDGLVISSQTIEYGQDAIEPQKPSKDQTAQYAYSFTGWTESFRNVTENIDTHPIYEQTLRSYNVEFINGDGDLIDTQVVEYGRSAIGPTTANKTHTDDIYYIFDGWDVSFASIKGDLTVTAQFREVDRYYTVTFYDQYGQVLDTQTIEYLNPATNPIETLPFEVLDDEFIYAIVGWDKSFDSITSNLDVHAVYDTVDRYYDVVFYHEDGTILSEQVVEYGHSASQPIDPIKAANDTYRYDFDGWDQSFNFITSDLNIYAKFTQTLTKFNVIFYDGDGNVFDEQVVLYGEDALNPDGIPTKSPTNSSMFEFTGWNISFNNVTNHLEVHAEFDELVRTFLVRFVDEDGNVLKEEYVPYNQAATAPDNYQIPESTEQFHFEPYWDRSFTNVTEDMQVVLQFKEVLRSYTYTFYDESGEIIKTVTAEYGSIITPPIAPEKAMTEKYVYTFIGWSPDIALELTGDVDYYPEFSEELRLYTVTYIDGNGDVFAEIQVPYGDRGALPAEIPTKDSTDQYYYTFTFWQVEPMSVKRDMVIPALFNRFLQEYKVTFIDEDGNILKQQMVEYGTGATEPESDLIPNKADTNEYTYTFAGWSRPFGNVTEDMIVQTVYIGVLRMYTYTFYDADQTTIIKQVSAPYGSEIIPPKNPTKDSTEYITYEFIGWDKVVSQTLTQNISYYAQYAEHGRSYNVIFYDGNGAVFEVQEVTFGLSAQNPNIAPTKNSDAIYDYVFKGWLEDFSNITDNLEVYPIFEPQLRTFDVTFINYDGQETIVEVEYGKSAVGRMVTPYRPGYRFDSWDKDITYITKDITVYAQFIANSYYVNFHPGVEADGSMDPIIGVFDSQVTIPENGYVRPGYYFAGWKTNPDGDSVEILDKDSFTLNEEGVDLYAEWIPVVYSIDYILDGGDAVNPTKYTIEDEIVLQAAMKEDYKFLGWYVVEVIQNDDGSTTTTYSTNLEGEVITVIDPGNIGNITLQAIYEYDGYIQLKEESTLGFYYADVETTIPIFEREEYNEENPVYLMGVFLNQTVGNLKENFINDNLVVIDKDGNEITDDMVVATGYQIIIRDEADETMVKDRVHIVLKGDSNGDGSINIIDYLDLVKHINSSSMLEASRLISMLLNDDTSINLLDYLELVKHINGSKLLHDPNKNSTLEIEGGTVNE